MAKKRASGGDVKLNKPIEYHANKPAKEDDVKLNTPVEYHANKPEPEPEVILNTPTEYHANKLTDFEVRKRGGKVKKKQVKAEGNKSRPRLDRKMRK